MENILDISKYIIERYKYMVNESMDEMKLHKLLYFLLRESIAINKKALFENDFEAWRLGPVSKKVRYAFLKGSLKNGNSKNISNSSKILINDILEAYGKIESFNLSMMTHNEYCFKNARKDTYFNEPCSEKIKTVDILKDAKKIRPYDYTWDGYYDELENDILW